MHVAITPEARERPSPLNCEYDWHLVSCLHAVGCVFAVQSIKDEDLNQLIAAIDHRQTDFPLESVGRLRADMRAMDMREFVSVVREMHGPDSLDWYRKTVKWVLDALSLCVKARQDLQIRYVDWQDGTKTARSP